MPVPWIDTARENLQRASANYANIQRQIDRYNKIFEAYSLASPETQIRAASVMRQALDEYNGLKRQQEENSLKIFEAQQWADYYNRSRPQQLQTTQSTANQTSTTNDALVDIVRPNPTEEIAVVTTATPWALNNNAPTTNVEVNAVDTNQTMNVPATDTIAQNNINPTLPIGVTKIINSQTPKYPNTTISPVNKQTYNLNTNAYWPGNVTTMPGTWWIVSLPTTNVVYRRQQWSNLGDTLNNWVRKWATYLYNYLK